MEKLKTFWKNYKKIILGSFIFLILIIFITGFILLWALRQEITVKNEQQLELIDGKYDEICGYCEDLGDVTENIKIRSISAIPDLIKLEPEDLDNGRLLSEYASSVPSIMSITVLGEDKSAEFCTGEKKDYTDPCYDELFKGGEGESITCVSENGEDSFVSGFKCGDRYVIIEIRDIFSSYLNSDRPRIWNMAYCSVGLSDMSSFAVVDGKDGRVTVTDEPDFEGAVIDCDKLNGNTLLMGDKEYIFQKRADEEKQVILLALTPLSVVKSDWSRNVAMIILLFVGVLIILIAYVVCLREGELDPEKEYTFLNKYFLKTQTSRFKILAVLCTVSATMIFLTLANLNRDKKAADYISGEADKCLQAAEYVTVFRQDIAQLRSETVYGLEKAADSFLSEHEEYLTKQGMEKLSSALGVKYVTVFDPQGNTVCTSSPLDNLNVLSEPESSLYGLKNVFIGKEGVCVSADTSKMEEGEVIYAVPRRNANKVAEGVIAVTDTDLFSGRISGIYEPEERILLNSSRDGGSIAVLVTDAEGRVLNSNSDYSGSFLPEETLKDGYYSRTTVNGRDCIAAVREIDGDLGFVCLLYRSGWVTDYVLKRSLVVFIMFILMSLWVCYDGLGSKYHFEKRNLAVKDADDWQRSEPKWEELATPEKMGRIMRVFVYVFSFGLMLYLMLARRSFVDGNVITDYTLYSVNRSVNPYSVLENICVVCIFYTLISAVEWLLVFLEKTLGEGASTVCLLISSIIKYAGAIICVLVVASRFGFDTAATLASLGIVGFGITFGAQDLIKDMIAGMFIIFEGNYKVGDMLLIDGDWFWVKSIGVRTTKVEAWGTVRIINNSKMTGIVNMQEASACVDCDVMIGNEWDIDKVREVLERELPAVKAKFPPEVSTPAFKGIQKITGYGVLIRIRSYCPPIRQGYVGRQLREEVKRILDSNGIRIAMDESVVHTVQAKDQDKNNSDTEE